MTGLRCLRPTGPWAVLIVLGAFLAAGCSTSNNSGTSLVTPQGNHPPGFLSTHPSFAISDVTECTPCHGSDLTGGIANVSCFTAACHHGTIANWADPAVHGDSAKRAPGASGFVSCRICHAADFSGDGAGVACSDCHGVPAPHPAAPWRAAAPAPTHTNTDPANAPVCAACHFPGSPNNPAGHPPTPAPAGTPPGCFNSTLCHGAESAPHLLGATWRDPTSASFHGLTAKQDLAFCQSCHGTPGTTRFDGGTATTRCSDCHAAARAHPTTWYQAPVVTFPGYVPSHRNSSSQGTTCTICHDFTQGRTAPDPNAPSCFSASFANTEHASVTCHSGGPSGANHAVPFLSPTHTQATPAAFASDCSNCHADSATPPADSPPGCQVCHTAGSPLTLAACSSCHASPPAGGAGAAYPNVAGAHATHLALNGAGTPVTCATCHTGLESGSQAHYDRANARTGSNALRVSPGDVAFVPASYDAESGPPSFAAATFSCSNVSCHGGQANLNWQTGTLNVNTQCTSCHASGTTQFNSYNSGRHTDVGAHVSNGCTSCHDTALLAPGHFTALATPAFEQAPSTTIRTAVQFNGTTCNPSGGGISGCHGQETW
ncbi:MAG: CxxxxCH/CxxCH domain c-type cytochrome [Deltaproteobacteria bacterium]